MATAPNIKAIIRSRLDGRRRSTTNAVPDIKRPPAARAAADGTVKAYHTHGIRSVSYTHLDVYKRQALGYTMVYGIAKMLNFAHGDVIMVGAYVSFYVTMFAGSNLLGEDPSALTTGAVALVSVLLAMVVCTVLGVVIEGLAYRPLRQAGSLAVLITAIGVSYFLQNAAQLLFGAKMCIRDRVHIGNLWAFHGP